MQKEDFEDALNKAMEPMTKTIKDLKSKVESLEKSDKETKEALKKSRQNGDVEIKKEEKEDPSKGIL